MTCCFGSSCAFPFSDRGGGGGGDNFMGRGGNFGGDNFGRGKMTCDTVHLILCVSLYCSTSGVNNAVVDTESCIFYRRVRRRPGWLRRRWIQRIRWGQYHDTNMINKQKSDSFIKHVVTNRQAEASGLKCKGFNM